MSIDPPFFTYWTHPESYCVFTEPKGSPLLVNGNMDPLCEELTHEQFIKHVSSRDELPAEIDGIIKNAYKAYSFANDGNFCIKGQIYFDKHQRFTDGCPISTTFVRDIRSDGLVLTRNSVYLVEYRDQEPTKLPNGNPEASTEQPLIGKQLQANQTNKDEGDQDA